MIPATRAEMEKFFRDALDWDGYYRPYSEAMVDDIVSDINALTRERDEARAQAIEANTNAAYAQTHEESLRIHKASLIKKLDATEKQLAEARAEVERLNAPPSGTMIEQVCLALSLEVGADGILNKSGAAETVAGWLAVRYRNISEQADTIAALKAEIEQLRLKANAWDYEELVRVLERVKADKATLAEHHRLFSIAAARARAAKGQA